MVTIKSATDAADFKSPLRQANGTYLRYMSIGVRAMEILKSTNREKADLYDLIARLQGASMKLILFLIPLVQRKRWVKRQILWSTEILNLAKDNLLESESLSESASNIIFFDSDPDSDLCMKSIKPKFRIAIWWSLLFPWP